MKICIYAPEVGPEVETIAFFCRLAGATTIVAIHPDGERYSPHNFHRVGRDNITVSTDDPVPMDVLIADAFTKPSYKSQLFNWCKKAKEVALLFPHEGMTFKRRVGHIIKQWPVSVSSRTALFFGDRRISLNAVPHAFQRRAFFQPYLHPQTFLDDELKRPLPRPALTGSSILSAGISYLSESDSLFPNHRRRRGPFGMAQTLKTSGRAFPEVSEV